MTTPKSEWLGFPPNFESEAIVIVGAKSCKPGPRPWLEKSNLNCNGWNPSASPSNHSNIFPNNTNSKTKMENMILRNSESPLTFNVPSALPRIRDSEADAEFEKQKKLLAHRLPLLNYEQMARFRFPYHVVVLNDLAKAGYHHVLKELTLIFKMEDAVATKLSDSGLKYDKISSEKELLDTIVDGLKYAADLVRQSEYLIAIGIRKTIAEHMLRLKDKMWLSAHLYETCLDLTEELRKSGDVEVCARLYSEIKCVLGYLQINDKDEEHMSDAAMKTAIDLIQECRESSEGKDWILDLLEPNVLTVKLKKPICLIGLREDYEILDGHSMSLHSVATLLLYEMFHLRASAILYSKDKSTGKEKLRRLFKALEYARQAFEFANEIHDNVALNSAHMVLGEIYLKLGDSSLAIKQFTDLQEHAEFQQDVETEAIAYNLIGRAFMGLEDPINALENFVCQKELAETKRLRPLEVDALQHIGACLLQEGSTVEAELCFQEAFAYCQTFASPPRHSTRTAWASFGLTAGMNMWGRFSGHCRREGNKNMTHVSEWKRARKPIRPLGHPKPLVQVPTDVVPAFEPDKDKVPQLDTKSVLAFLLTVDKKAAESLANLQLTLNSDPSQSFLAAPSVHELDVKWSESHVNGKVVFNLAQTSSTQTLTRQDLYDTGYDEGEPTLYESDLKFSVTRAGNVFILKEIAYKVVTLHELLDMKMKLPWQVVKAQGATDKFHWKALQAALTARTLDIVLVPTSGAATGKANIKRVRDFERSGGDARRRSSYVGTAYTQRESISTQVLGPRPRPKKQVTGSLASLSNRGSPAMSSLGSASWTSSFTSDTDIPRTTAFENTKTMTHLSLNRMTLQTPKPLSRIAFDK